MNPKTDRFFSGDHRRALYLAIYDMQGGPLAEKLQTEVESAVEEIVNRYAGVAMLVTEKG